MKNTPLLFLLFLVILSCHSDSNYTPDSTLSKDKQEAFKYKIVRYTAKLVKQATQETKFEKRFDENYQKVASKMNLDKYFYNEKDGFTYFEVSRIAPSNQVKYVATGGRIKRDAQGEISEYEEIYRTWKMGQEDLAKKTATYFDHMVNGKDLSPFYTENIGNTENIEFPDAQTSFNKESRQWEFRLPDSLVVNK